MAEFYLFAGDEYLRDYLHHRRQVSERMLHNYEPDLLLNTSDGDAIAHVVEAGRVEELVLHTDRREMDLEEVFKDNDLVQNYQFKGARRLVNRRTVSLPFTGEAKLLGMRVHGQASALPLVEVVGYEIRLTSDDDYGPTGAAAIKEFFYREIEGVSRLIDGCNAQIRAHNQKLAEDTPGRVAARKRKHLADREMQAEIGFPMRVRNDAGTFAIPIKRTRVTPARATSSRPFAPEPSMADEHYEAALEVLLRLRNGFERNPTIAAKAKEEQIRDLLLFHLNGHFEGEAAGEVFNKTGKTDILIRHLDRNVFIAECKVWTGPKKFGEAIDQLLGYLTWRDTKAALLAFVKRPNMTAIMAKAVEVMKAHKNFKREGRVVNEDRHDFVLRPHDDPDREINVALIFIQIPAIASPSPDETGVSPPIC